MLYKGKRCRRRRTTTTSFIERTIYGAAFLAIAALTLGAISLSSARWFESYEPAPITISVPLAPITIAPDSFVGHLTEEEIETLNDMGSLDLYESKLLSYNIPSSAADDLTASGATCTDTGVDVLLDVNASESAIEFITCDGISITAYDDGVNYTSLIQTLMNVGVEYPTSINDVFRLCSLYEAQRNVKTITENLDFDVTHVFTAGVTFEDAYECVFPEPVHTPYMEYTQYDLDRLAAIIYAEAGSDYITDYHQQCVASVVICRVESPYFTPTTIAGVIDAYGQYPNTCGNRYYDDRAEANARYVLENGPVVQAIWQAEFKQGQHVVEVFSYPGHTTTYICDGPYC